MAEPPAVTAPPRNISNILKILDARKLDDPEGFDRLLRRSNELPPKDVSKNALARFYLERGMAADRVGRAGQSIDDLTKANGLGSDLPLEERLVVLRALVSAELSGGNSSRALGYLRDSVELSESLEVPEAHQIRLYARYASVLAKAGNLKDASLSLAKATTLMERIANHIRKYVDESDFQSSPASPIQKTLWNVVGHELIAVTSWARGDFLRAAGRYTEAEAAYRTSIDYFFRDQARDRVNLVRVDLAVALVAQGRHMEAEIAARHALLFALRIYGRSHYRTGQRVQGLAEAIEAQGRLEKAERLHRAALDIAKTAGAAPGSYLTVRVQVALAANLARQDRWKEARAQFGLAEKSGAGDAAMLKRYVRANGTYALVLLRTGDAVKALAVARRAIARRAELMGEDHMATIAAKGIAAAALMALGREDEGVSRLNPLVSPMLSHLQPAVGGTGGSADQWHIRTILEAHMARLARSVSPPHAARHQGATAFRIADTLRDRKVQHALGHTAARAAADNPELARIIRRHKTLADRHVALQELHADVLSHPANSWQDKPFDRADCTGSGSCMAQRLSDRSVERLEAEREELIEKLAAERGLKLGFEETTKGDPDIQISDDTSYYSGRFFGNYHASRGVANETPSDRLSREIAAVGRERARIAARIAKRLPEYAEFVDPPAPNIEQARTALKQGEALIAIYVAEDATYVWAVPSDGAAAFVRVPIGRKGLSQMVAKLRKGLKFRGNSLAGVPVFDTRLAHRLYKSLLEPVARGWKGARSLVIVPHGPLAQLPFSLLVTGPAEVWDRDRPLFAGYRDVPWLVRSHGIATLSSVAELISLRRAPRTASRGARFAGFADPVFNRLQVADAAPRIIRKASLRAEADRPIVVRSAPAFTGQTLKRLGDLAPLPETAGEVRGIAVALGADPNRDTFTGPRANEERVKSIDLRRYRIVAFATHALLPYELEGLDQPALALSAPEVAGVDGDGLLTRDEILRLKLDADWVLLSGCNTGAGRGRGANAVSGLGRAFLHAGARSLMITHWEVDSRVARLLVTDMFRRQASDLSLRPGEAMRRAKLAMINGPGYPDRDGETLFSYAHPIFWAPFALFGDGQTASVPSQKLGGLPKN